MRVHVARNGTGKNRIARLLLSGKVLVAGGYSSWGGGYLSSAELYEGYKRLLQRLYSHRNYRRRVMQLILHKGTQIERKVVSSRKDLGIFTRVLWTCILRASPRRAWLTLSLMGETLVRRPRSFRDAITLALIGSSLIGRLSSAWRFPLSVTGPAASLQLRFSRIALRRQPAHEHPTKLP